jgi:hypothetical protein
MKTYLKSKLKYYAAALLFLVTSIMSGVSPLLVGQANAHIVPPSYPSNKVFVCKYVGKPNVDERLQTGNNPISVSVNAVAESPVTLGSYFADAQGQSFVLDWDSGQPDPDVSQCPAGRGVTVIAVPSTPATDDPCGSYNASWVVPSDTAQLDWSVNFFGWLSVQTKSGYVFADGTTSHNYGYVTDSNTPCPTRVSVPTKPNVTDPCGLNNATWVKPNDSVSISWNISSGHLVATTKTGYVFTDGTTTHDYGVAADSNVLCPPTPVSVPAMPAVNDPCGPANSTWVKPSDTTSVTWSISQSGHLIAATTTGFIFSDGKTTHDFGTAPDSGVACVKKVFVCKYVGTPGVDERLQTGQNPISVSVNAIQNNQWNGTVPGWFSDAHDRSYVLAYDNGQPTPDVSQCPAPQQPTQVNPGTVTFTDATCAAAGFYVVPSTTGVVYKDGAGTVLAAGNHAVIAGQNVTVTAYAATGYVLSGTGATSWTHTFVAASGCGGGQVLGDTTTTPATTPVVASATTTAKQLADTGTSVVLPTILAIAMTITSVGVLFGNRMQRKSATSDPTL